MVECYPTSANQSRLHQCGKKVLPGIFLGYAWYAGRIWKGNILVTHFEELDNSDVSEIHARRLHAKEILTPKMVNTS